MDLGWSFEDKKKILEILYKLGSSDYELIHQQMPEKSLTEIKFFCDSYRKLAMKKWERSKANNNGDVALKNWLVILKHISSAQTGSLTDIIPRALKYIALFEKRTENSCVNLKDCYMTLSDISKGLSGKKNSETQSYFYYECLLKLAKSVKHGGDGPSLKYLKYLTNLRTFKSEEQKERKKLSHSRLINPLSVPENLLYMSGAEKNILIFE